MVHLTVFERKMPFSNLIEAVQDQSVQFYVPDGTVGKTMLQVSSRTLFLAFISYYIMGECRIYMRTHCLISTRLQCITQQPQYVIEYTVIAFKCCPGFCLKNSVDHIMSSAVRFQNYRRISTSSWLVWFLLHFSIDVDLDSIYHPVLSMHSHTRRPEPFHHQYSKCTLQHSSYPPFMEVWRRMSTRPEKYLQDVFISIDDALTTPGSPWWRHQMEIFSA